MLLDAISFELPDWEEPLSIERADRMKWFERLASANGDGAALPTPVRLRQQAVELQGDN
jgi:hypothetical protein